MGHEHPDPNEHEDVTAHSASRPRQAAHDLARNPRAWRDLIIFAVGLLGVIHEVFFTELDRPGLLTLFGLMIGLAGLGRSNGNSN